MSTTTGAASSAAQLSLREALRIIRAHGAGQPGRQARVLGLGCSFTPLHLETFVRAYLLRQEPDADVQTVTGTYGDLAGCIEDLAAARVGSAVVIVEWPDLDPRLGWRESVGAPIADAADIAATTHRRLERIAARLERLAAQCRTVVALPALDLPAAYDGADASVGVLRAQLDLALAGFAERLVHLPGLVLARERIEGPRDLRSEIRSGFPFTADHASALARTCVELLRPPATKKGLITDLDDTLWKGLVGEIGAEAVTWDLDSGGQPHALYQQLLAALSKRGVLVAVASKNDPEVVSEALRRPDLHVAADALFPIEVSWNPKSRAVDSILKAWNIASSDVVFVDDSPMELAEVAARHPDITTIRFPSEDPGALGGTLREINRLLWREDVTAEDALRVSSLRAAADLGDARAGAEDERGFLVDLAGRITVRSGSSWQQPRVRELVNKTNQFNLNGRRYDEAQWRDLCTRPGAFTWTIAYEDRFGPLGVISVLAGVRTASEVTVDCWVLSCRAFSRAIEHHVLRALCAGTQAVGFDFQPTERNAVLRTLMDRVAPSVAHGRRRLDAGLLTDAAPADVHATDLPIDDDEEPNTHG